MASEPRAKGGETLRRICTGERARRERKERERRESERSKGHSCVRIRLSREGEPHAETRRMPARGRVPPEVLAQISLAVFFGCRRVVRFVEFATERVRR